MYAIWLYRPDQRVQQYRPDRRVQRYRPGRRAQRAMTRPEGPTSYGTGGYRWDTAAGGLYCSLEWHMCCMRYFGELTKQAWLPCYVLCVSGTSDDRGKAPAWLYTHFWFGVVFVDPGIEQLFWKLVNWFWRFNDETYVLWILKMKILVWNFLSLQVGIRALVWGIRIHSRVCMNSN